MLESRERDRQMKASVLSTMSDSSSSSSRCSEDVVQDIRLLSTYWTVRLESRLCHLDSEASATSRFVLQRKEINKGAVIESASIQWQANFQVELPVQSFVVLDSTILSETIDRKIPRRCSNPRRWQKRNVWIELPGFNRRWWWWWRRDAFLRTQTSPSAGVDAIIWSIFMVYKLQFIFKGNLSVANTSV